jgi:O-antigen/teichoic acid export membrane protein
MSAGPPANLKARSLVAMLWSGADLFMRQGVQFVVAIILARLLSPEEFGTIALLYLFVGIAGVFADGGFSSALVQKQDATHADESTVFWINLAMGALVASALWLVAPWIAAFFGYPVLVPLAGMLAISLFLNALGSIHLVLFSKRLEFRRPMMISVSAALTSGTVAILLADRGFGVWALAWQAVVSSLVSTLLFWTLSPWRPAAAFSLASARRLFRFGGYLMMSGLLDVIYNRISSLLIGKVYGVRDLAFYNRADNTKQIPVDVLSNALGRVAFPMYSAAAGSPDRLRNGIRLSVQGMTLINTPMMLGLLATAENLVPVLFGEKWQPAVPILQVLCIAGIFWPFHVINLNVLKAQGHSDLFFRLEIVKKIVGVSCLAIGSLYGVMGIAWSQVAFGLAAFLINAHYTGKQLRYGAYAQAGDASAVFLVSAAMALAVFAIGRFIEAKMPVVLSVQIITGVIMFVALAVLFRLEVYRVVSELIRRRQIGGER